ncbi:MAG: hypothetical protein WBV82_31235 [Myxococcaceae bacterium]
MTGIAGMIVGIFAYQNWNEARLARHVRIELPIESMGRSVLVALLSLVPVPVAMGAIDAWVHPWTRQNAPGAVLIGIGGSDLSLLAGIALTRKFRRIGALEWSQERIELRVGGEVATLDLTRPFALFEAGAIGPGGVQAQVVVLKQGDRAWGFSYGLRLGRKPYGNAGVDGTISPFLGGAARVIHDRLRGSSLATLPHQASGLAVD